MGNSTVKIRIPVCAYTTMIAIMLFWAGRSMAQTENNSEELFKLARKEAFDNNSYPKAIALLKKAIDISPDYIDLHIFLGRIYTWEGKIDSANQQFGLVLSKNPENEEALNASFDLNFWNHNHAKALEFAQAGLAFYPTSEEFAIKKAKALNALSRPIEALVVTQAYLEKNPGNMPMRTLQESIQSENMKNRIGISYSYSYFDKRFPNDWQQGTLSYTRDTKIGPFTFNVNHANRFATTGTEYEIESFPHIDTGFYAYVGGGYSNSSIFSNYRAGFSIFKSLGKGYEAEAGMRFLHFTSTAIIIVPGLGRYLGDNYVGLRSYIIPNKGRVSVSFNLLARFFLTQDRFDFYSVSLGTGVSPDDRLRRIDINSNLKTFRAGLDYSRNVLKKYIVTAGGSIAYEEYFTKTHGNQYSISAGIQRKF